MGGGTAEYPHYINTTVCIYTGLCDTLTVTKVLSHLENRTCTSVDPRVDELYTVASVHLFNSLLMQITN